MTLQDWLATPVIVALPDVHGQAEARRQAESLLRQPGLVKTFFIEYESTASTSDPTLQRDYGRTLNAAISEMLDLGTSATVARQVLPGYFGKLNPADAQPGLVSLTATAVGKGVQVLAADMDYAAAVDELAKEKLSPINLFLSAGLSIRDRAASRTIANYLAAATSVATGRLMLWGANHFTENTATESFCDTRLQIQLAQLGLQVHVATPQEMAP
jgi:hypothetical protein